MTRIIQLQLKFWQGIRTGRLSQHVVLQLDIETALHLAQKMHIEFLIECRSGGCRT